jgi:glutamate-1-semialdehyde aminotransferase
MLAARSPAVPRVDAVGSASGALKTAIRSFRFGTDRP